MRRASLDAPFKPRHPLLSAMGFRAALPIAERFFRHKHIYRSNSHYMFSTCGALGSNGFCLEAGVIPTGGVPGRDPAGIGGGGCANPPAVAQAVVRLDCLLHYGADWHPPGWHAEPGLLDLGTVLGDLVPRQQLGCVGEHLLRFQHQIRRCLLPPGQHHHQR